MLEEKNSSQERKLDEISQCVDDAGNHPHTTLFSLSPTNDWLLLQVSTFIWSRFEAISHLFLTIGLEIWFFISLSTAWTDHAMFNFLKTTSRACNSIHFLGRLTRKEEIYPSRVSSSFLFTCSCSSGSYYSSLDLSPSPLEKRRGFMTDGNGIQDKGVQQKDPFISSSCWWWFQIFKREKGRKIAIAISLGGKVVTPKVTWRNKSWKTTFWYLISLWVAFFGNLSCLQYKHRGKEDFNILVLSHVEGRKQRRHQLERFTQSSTFSNIASFRSSQTQTCIFFLSSPPFMHQWINRHTNTAQSVIKKKNM